MANFTKLLLHCDGADTSTTFTDSSIYAHTVTPAGNAQIDTAQSKFGGASGIFTASTDYISSADSADWDFGTGDFTIDFWVRMTSATSDRYFVDRGSGDPVGGDYAIFFNGGNSLHFRIGGSGILTPSWSPSADTWYHIAVARSGTALAMYVDGTSIATAVNSTDITYSNAIRIGSRVLGGFALAGWIDEFRISKGIARWTTNFTPPTSAYDDPSSTSSSSSSSSCRSSSSSSSSSSSRSSSSSSSSCRSSSSSSSSSNSSSSSSSSSSSRSSSSSSRSSSSSSSSRSSSSSSSSSSRSSSSSSSSSSSRSSSSSSSSSRSSSSSSRSSSSSSSSMSHAIYKIDGIDKISKTITYAAGEEDSYVNDVDTDLNNLFQEINRGFKPIRVTTAQRNAITDLYEGLIVVNVSTHKLNFYTGSGWEAITSS